jgi:hypothetical protein
MSPKQRDEKAVERSQRQPASREPEDQVEDEGEPSEETGGPPPYDAAAVGRVAARVEIASVELLGAYFERADDGPLPTDAPGELTPAIGIGGVEWEISSDRAMLGCVVNFGATFDEEPEPYELYARFRLAYLISEGTELDAADVHQFANWNSVFNAWPYWREYLSSTINRAQLPRFLVPVMGVPRMEAPQ